MIKAILLDSDRVIFASRDKEKEIRELARDKRIICPCCRTVVKFNCGKKKIAHFSHLGDVCPFTEYEKETYEHLKGKQILFNWLVNKFPKAEVEMESFIIETNQIADILVTGMNKEKEIKIAFEFQHSKLSIEEWKRRHELYKKAGIIDFWIFDANVFIKNSTARGWTDARKKNQLCDEIYKRQRFCYYLDVEKEKILIDYAFIYRTDTNYFNGKRVTNEYKLHNPIKNIYSLENIHFLYSNKFNIAALNVENDKEIKDKWENLIEYKEQELQRLEEEAREERYIEFQSYLLKKHKKEEVRYICRYLNINKLEKEIMVMKFEEIYQKYKTEIELIINNFIEYESWKDSEDIEKYILKSIVRDYDLYDFKNININNPPNFFEFVNSKYQGDLNKIKYVYNQHFNILERFTKFRTNFVNKKLCNIKFELGVSVNEPTPLDYAIRYRYLNSNKEIDETIEKAINSILPLYIDLNTI